MGRKPRFTLPGQPQHIIQRGLARAACFFAPADYRLYLELLAVAAAGYDCHVHVCVLMSSHVHPLATPRQSSGISFVMQRLAQRYVRTINQSYHRTGTLWEGRYRAGQIDTEPYLLSCMRCIELKPVRARMVAHPADYAWPNYRHNPRAKQTLSSRIIPSTAGLAMTRHSGAGPAGNYSLHTSRPNSCMTSATRQGGSWFLALAHSGDRSGRC